MDSIFKVLGDLQKQGIDIEDKKEVFKELKKYDINDFIKDNINYFIEIYKLGIDFYTADADTISYFLVSHWLSHLYELPSGYNSPQNFVGYCMLALKEGGLDWEDDSDWGRVSELVDRALKINFNEDMSLDELLRYGGKKEDLIMIFAKEMRNIESNVSKLTKKVNKVGFLNDDVKELKIKLKKLNEYKFYLLDRDYRELAENINELKIKVNNVIKEVMKSDVYEDYNIEKQAGLLISNKYNEYFIKKVLGIKNDFRKMGNLMGKVMSRYTEALNKNKIHIVKLTSEIVSVEIQGIDKIRIKKELLKKFKRNEEKKNIIHIKGSNKIYEEICRFIEKFAFRSGYNLSGDEYFGYVLEKLNKKGLIDENMFKNVKDKIKKMNCTMLNIKAICYDGGELFFNLKNVSEKFDVIGYFKKYKEKIKRYEGLLDFKLRKDLSGLKDMGLEKIKLMANKIGADIDEDVMEYFCGLDDKYCIVDFEKNKIICKGLALDIEVFLKEKDVISFKVGDLVSHGADAGIIEEIARDRIIIDCGYKKVEIKREEFKEIKNV